MAEKTQDSGSQGGTGATPNAPDSTQQGDKPSSGQQVVLTKEALDNLLNQAVDRGKQAGKDRAVSDTNKRLDKLEGDVRPILERAQQEGKSVGDVLADLNRQQEADDRQVMRDFVNALREGKLPGSVTGNDQSKGVDAAKVFEQVGLKSDDPDVAIELGKQFENAEQAELAAFRLRERISKKPNPTQAQNPALTNNDAPKADLDALSAEYDSLKLDPVRNYARMQEIEEAINKEI